VGARLGGLLVVAVLLAVGVLIGSHLAQFADSPPAAPSLSGSVGRTAERVRVEVLNGGGVEGMAREGTNVLRDGGFDVVFFGNAQSFDLDSTVVIDRVGRLDLARSVAHALGVSRVESRPDSNLYLDATVLLGSDWTAPERAPEPMDAFEREPAWWDVRHWFSAPVPPLQGGPIADPAPGGGG